MRCPGVFSGPFRAATSRRERLRRGVFPQRRTSAERPQGVLPGPSVLKTALCVARFIILEVGHACAAHCCRMSFSSGRLPSAAARIHVCGALSRPRASRRAPRAPSGPAPAGTQACSRAPASGKQACSAPAGEPTGSCAEVAGVQTRAAPRRPCFACPPRQVVRPVRAASSRAPQGRRQSARARQKRTGSSGSRQVAFLRTPVRPDRQ